MMEFNLIYEPWIKCRLKTGEDAELSLLELFRQAQDIADISSDEPIVDGGLYRLLLAILARMFGPKSYNQWNDLFTKGKFDIIAIENYFKKWEHRFNLLDANRPFYQTQDDRVKPKSPLKLMPHLASGNNTTLFNHNTDEDGISLSCAQGARFVIALQHYGLGGLSGIEQKFTAAPPCRGISFFIKGQNLFETLALNLIQYTGEDIRPIPADTFDDDLPCWEMDDPFVDRDEPFGLLDYLTWQNRKVLLIPTANDSLISINSITEAPGLKMNDDYIDGVKTRDPYQYYYRGKTKAPLVLRFSTEREVWRNSASLLRYTDDLAPSENVRWLKELMRAGILFNDQMINLDAFGMAADKAKVNFYKRSTFPLPLDYLQNDDLVMSLQEGLSISEEISNGLYRATAQIATKLLSLTRSEMDVDSTTKKNLIDHLNAESVYWASLEPHFYELILHLPEDRDASLRQWEEAIQSSARQALEHAIRLAGESVAVLKASVHARAILEKNLREKLISLRKETANE